MMPGRLSALTSVARALGDHNKAKKRDNSRD